jgi:hypothetical protein
MNKILFNAEKNYQFFETNSNQSNKIYNDYNPTCKLKVIDICCGLGSLVDPWYKNNHDITLIEFNSDFIPILKEKYPKATIIKADYLNYENNELYDVYLCNPPFKLPNIITYQYFFVKILNEMQQNSTFYFISPKNFYLKNLKIEEDDLPSCEKSETSILFNKYKMIELDSTNFRFNKTMVKKMIEMKLINKNFLINFEKRFMINPYFYFLYIGNVYDFKSTKCRCGLFKIIK